ncbi:MAG TPA: serine hydrolase domain-containing protein [Acidimicrobiia bacterium]|jgi:D-alanyl-D-alanine carboxypeptidase|nr:serine hydrolase domain-containing protein [Acidimicrobiia bacterium]
MALRLTGRPPRIEIDAAAEGARAGFRGVASMRPDSPLRKGRLGTMAVVVALMAVACGGAEQVAATTFNESTEPTSGIETSAASPTKSDRVAGPMVQLPIAELPAADLLQATLDAGVIEHGGKGFTFAVILPDGKRWVGVTGVSHGTTKVTPDVLFAAGSITKTWTATTIMQLAEEGVLSLDDPVCEWLPEIPNVDRSITLRQLLNHTSGVHDYIDHPDYWKSAVWDEPDRSWTPGETLATYLLEPYFAPGTAWHYSNSGYVLLRMIIMEATGSDIATVYRNRFFDPLGLDGTFVIPGEEPPNNIAHGWWDLDGDGEYDDFSATPYTAFASGLGGQVFTTAEDLAEWTRALYHEQTVLRADSFAEMIDFYPTEMEDEPLLDGYGLGAVRFAPEFVSGLEVWGHGGDAPGYAAGAFYLPDYGISMGFADNTERGDAMPLIDDMMGLILGLTVETP